MSGSITVNIYIRYVNNYQIMFQHSLNSIRYIVCIIINVINIIMLLRKTHLKFILNLLHIFLFWYI